MFVWRRHAALSSVMVLAVMVALTSCDGRADVGRLDAESAGQQEVVEIVVWDKPREGSVDKPVIQELFRRFDAAHPHIRVKHVEPTFQREREQFMTAVAGGEQPDLYNSAFPDMETYLNQGIPADMTELWSAYPEREQYLPGALAAAMRDGRIYGVPNFMYVSGLAYNKQLFREAGVDPSEALQSWTSFGEAAERLTDRSKGTYGYAMLGTDWADWFFEYYVWQAGGDLTERLPGGHVRLRFTSEEAIAALQYYKDLRFKYRATQRNVLQSLDDNIKDFFSGRAATMIATSNWFGEMVSAGMDVRDIGFAPLPPGPGGVSPSQVGGGIWIFNPKASEEKRKAAFTYATYMTSKEALELMLQYQSEHGIFPNLLSIRQDVDVDRYAAGMPKELIANVKQVTEQGRLEYYMKSRLSPYVSRAVQQVLMDENADPLTVMQAAEQLVQREVVDRLAAETGP
ncbi:extracellular solute-binding protein [Paenibacillus sp. YYML68]|uniref:extracellular solute-binding protein n=1 Tax=Paenibacillus sp. YYML68 TaxID=2909250 RepID=UPI0024902DD3|nr:extracellular solute-binding protein [Paenibacillus sp. YYML68]